MILSSSNSVFSSRFARGTDDNESTNQDDHSLAKFSLPNDSQLSSEETDLGAQQHAQNALDSSRLIDASPVETLIQQLVENGTEFLHLLSHSAASSSAESLASPTNTTTGSSSSNDAAMIVVDEKAAELFPFDQLLPMIVVALSVSFIVIGGAIPYVFQYAEIYRRKSAAGFSLLVCLALCIANILRIEFWIGKRFELPLLVQSIVMLAVMAGMLEISVRMNRRIVPLTARTSVWNGDFISAFWKWNDLSSFVFALGLFTALCSLLNAMFHKNVFFVETMGMSALLVEACLGVPQLVRNFQRKSTIGMSVKMVLMWFIGDVGKTIYFVVRHSPEQFWICSLLQISIDVLILLQVWAYGQHSAAGGGANGGGGGGTHGSRLPRYVTSSKA